MTTKLLEDLKRFLEVYETADRTRWEEKRHKAVLAIQKELTKRQDDMKLFEEFWSIYPKKQNKPDSKKAWAQTVEVRPGLSVLISAVLSQCKTESWMQGYVPLPASWLRGHRWADEIEIKLPGVVNEKPWHETATGIELKGKEFGLNPADFDSFPMFKAAVMRASMKAA